MTLRRWAIAHPNIYGPPLRRFWTRRGAERKAGPGWQVMNWRPAS